MKFFMKLLKYKWNLFIGLLVFIVALSFGFIINRLVLNGNLQTPASLNTTQEVRVVSSNAQTEIAVIDLKKIAMESKAGCSIEQQINAINESTKKDLQELEAKMKSAENMENNKLSDNETRKLEDMQFVLHDMVNTKRSQISEAYKKAIYELEVVVNKSIEQISQQLNLGVVLTSDAAVFISSQCRDITGDVIRMIDETCPYISVVMQQK